MIEIGTITALVAGLLTFFAPCTLPLIPAFIGYLGTDTKNSNYITPVISFCIGFSIVFISLGLAAGKLSEILIQSKSILTTLGGTMIILLGLYLMFKNQLTFGVNRVSGFPLRSLFKSRLLNSFAIGVIFSLTFSPCIGPILGSILTLAVTSGSQSSAAFLMGVYSLGFSIPFIIVGIFFKSISPKLTTLSPRTLRLIEVVGAVLLIIFGLYLLFDFYLNPLFIDLIGNEYESWFIKIFGNYI